MADEEGGLLAIMSGEPEKKGKKPKGGASSAKARALESMFSNMQSGDFDAAAEDFATAYDECAMGGGDEEE